MAARLPPPGSERVVYVVDLSGYIFRAYHAVSPLSSPSGEVTHAIHGTLNMLAKVRAGRKPVRVVVAMDSKAPSFRKALDARYKANRPPAPEDLSSQIARCEQIARAMGLLVLQEDGVEADDLIATVTARALADGWRVVVVSADKDLMQLVHDDDERVLQWDSGRDSVYGPAEVKEKWGVRPSQLADLLALTGDTSDNVPGVPGVGPKTAADLLNKYETLAGVYANIDQITKPKLKSNLLEHKAEADLSRVLVSLKADLNIAWSPDIEEEKPDNEQLRALYTELGMTRMLSAMGDIVGLPAAPKAASDEAPVPLDKPKAPSRKDGEQLSWFSEEPKASKPAPPAPPGPPDTEVLMRGDLAAYLIDPDTRGNPMTEGIGEVSMRRLKAEGLDAVYTDIEVPLAKVLSAMKTRGVLVDVPALQAAAEAAGVELVRLDAKAQELAGRPFSVRSRDQLETILFDELKLKVIKKTPKGGRSTDAEVLEVLAIDHPLPGVLLEYRELDKLKGTYLDALPKWVSPVTKRIHPTYQQTVAATGRLSCADPNLQNIPTRTALGKRIREAFIAPEGYRLLSLDYSQIELRVLAHISGDENLRAAFTGNVDIHTHTASLMFNVPIEQVSKELRYRAKAVNFGVIYGMGELALAKQTGVSRKEAAAFIDDYFVRFPGVRGYMAGVLAEAEQTGMVRTLTGRLRRFPNLLSTNRVLRSDAQRAAKNTPIQGSAADILKLAMLSCEKVQDARMIMTVHDELVFEVKEELAEKVGAELKERMEQAMKLSVPLDVNLGIGKTWGQAH